MGGRDPEWLSRETCTEVQAGTGGGAGGAGEEPGWLVETATRCGRVRQGAQEKPHSSLGLS